MGTTKLNKVSKDAMAKIFNNFLSDIVLNKEFVNLEFEFCEDKEGGRLHIDIKRGRSFYRSNVARKYTFENGCLLVDGSQEDATAE